MSMRILIYAINFSPELTGIGKYSGEMAEWLAARGHAIRVVTAPPYYPAWRISMGFRNWWSTEIRQCVDPVGIELTPRMNLGQPSPTGHSSCKTASNIEGSIGSLGVWRCPLWVPFQPGGLKRLLHLASFAFSSFPVMFLQITWRPHVVWVVEPALFCAPTALAVARICGAKAWLHVQDFEVDAAFELGLLKGQQMRRLVMVVERLLMRHFDVVSTISKRMHQRLLDKGVAPEKVRLAINWVNMATFALTKPEAVAIYRKVLGIAPNAVIALYSGNMGRKQGIEILAEVASLFEQGGGLINAQESVVFVFCGDGVGRDDLEVRCLGLANVKFLDLQPASCLPVLLAMADIHLLPQSADAADLVMPSKLTGMLASARPVVATAHAGSELAEVVQGCGLVVPPADPQAMAQAVNTLAGNPAMRKRLGLAGLSYAQKNLDKETVLDLFNADLQAMVSKLKLT